MGHLWLATSVAMSIIGHVAAQAVVPPPSLNVSSDYSIRNVAATIAHGALGYYSGNTSSDPEAVGDLNEPYYWWVGGALWGGLLDYWHYTGDPSYNHVVLEALSSPYNMGPNHDYVPPEHADEEGNDDLYFWGSAALAAAERNFPQPDASIPPWLDVGANVFNSLLSRWNTSHCGGGLTWQIYPDNPNGMNYRNSISNGGFFQVAARLARATGNATYLEWAERAWDWSWKVGLVDRDSYRVWDGTDSANGCADVNRQSYTYTAGVYLYGAAVLANHTADPRWSDRATRILDAAADAFFGPSPNATDVLYEEACEPRAACNADMETHKAYLARNMWQSTLMVPSLAPTVRRLLTASAQAAAATCTGGLDGLACGQKWYVGGFDGLAGLGPQMTALETIQGLLVHRAAPPLRGADIRVVRDASWPPVDPYRPDVVLPQLTEHCNSTSTSTSTSTATPTPTPTSAPTMSSTTASRASATVSMSAVPLDYQRSAGSMQAPPPIVGAISAALAQGRWALLLASVAAWAAAL